MWSISKPSAGWRRVSSRRWSMTCEPYAVWLKDATPSRPPLSWTVVRCNLLRWVVERSFAWAARFRRLARDYERLPETLAGQHFIAFAIVLAGRFVQLAQLLAQSS